MVQKTLPTAVLGRTGLEVTRIGYGASGRKSPDNRQWGRLLNAVLDSGINFIDTANDYGVRAPSGPSEEQIGRHVESRRAEYYLATKCGCVPGGLDHVWTRENAFRGLHESLARMNTDYVDVMQLHNPTAEQCETGDLVKALEDMRQQGKVRWIGVSTTLPELPTFLELGVFDVFQVPYSALERDHEEWITRTAEAGIGVIVRGGVAQGEPGVDSGGSQSPAVAVPPAPAWFPVRPGGVAKWRAFYEGALDDLRQEGESRTSLILRYTLTHPHADTNIVGTSSLDHLAENIQGILRGPLSAEEYSEAKRRLDAAGVKPA